ncbi:hypothetical protein [Prevotella denticola]|uniref:hypothetical protein n=1 Tax=Prevotella denticola TaxID=28129 RepID=UPI000E58D167|nr:hypothetical protein [Prevotella denticola]AXV48890.1 hypothetical protein DYJ25_03460 [Prevotella denticola]
MQKTPAGCLTSHNDREHCSQRLGIMFPTAGNEFPDRSGIRHNAGRYDEDFAVSVGKQATAG